jgi:hypothetical protein
MFSAFEKPLHGAPRPSYAQIVRDHPKSPLAPRPTQAGHVYLFKYNYLRLEAAPASKGPFRTIRWSPGPARWPPRPSTRWPNPCSKTTVPRIAELWREHPPWRAPSIISDKGQLAAALSLCAPGTPGTACAWPCRSSARSRTRPGSRPAPGPAHLCRRRGWREILERRTRSGVAVHPGSAPAGGIRRGHGPGELGDTPRAAPVGQTGRGLQPAPAARAGPFTTRPRSPRPQTTRKRPWSSPRRRSICSGRPGPDRRRPRGPQHAGRRGKGPGPVSRGPQMVRGYAATLPENGPDFRRQPFPHGRHLPGDGDTPSGARPWSRCATPCRTPLRQDGRVGTLGPSWRSVPSPSPGSIDPPFLRPVAAFPLIPAGRDARGRSTVFLRLGVAGPEHHSPGTPARRQWPLYRAISWKCRGCQVAVRLCVPNPEMSQLADVEWLASISSGKRSSRFAACSLRRG